MRSAIVKLGSRLEALRGSGTNVNVVDMYSCLTGDVISQYAFTRSYNLLDTPDFAPHWHALWMDNGRSGHLLKQFGWLVPMLRCLPTWMVDIVAPSALVTIHLQKVFLFVAFL